MYLPKHILPLALWATAQTSLTAATAITGAAYDPNDPDTGLVSNGTLALTSGTLTFDLPTRSYSGSSSGTGTFLTTPDPNYDDYVVYLFDSIDLGAGVTITVNNAGNTSPGIALLSLSNITLNANLSYNSSSVSNDGGDIVLVAENTLLVNSTISSVGRTATQGNQSGTDGGNITLAATTMNLQGATLTTQGGSGHNSNKPKGDGGTIDLFAANLTGSYTTNVTQGAVGSGGLNGQVVVHPGLAYLQVPEPSTSMLAMLGIIGMSCMRRRHR
ncbi:PEP-CTERM sorting domain-containing protein [Rubritalea tangerina]|uniref:PEP-CTERM sorting domain-containing protein n=1 Tax=Rubritalea tangerina TaxID=430798 RepID=A0ABW4ZDH5_9BACT